MNIKFSLLFFLQNKLTKYLPYDNDPNKFWSYD